MILTCPSCATRYQTDSERFAAPGRNVRCAKCGHVWFQAAPLAEVEPELEPAFSPEPQAMAVATAVHADSLGGLAPSNFGDAPDAAGTFARERKPWGLHLAQAGGWAALVLMVVGLGWATVQYRQAIANLWPQSASLYAALGMPVNVRGIALIGVAYRQDVQDGQPVLSVTGKVVNVSGREMPVPEIRVVLTDDSKHELYHWTFDVGVPTLKPGAESPFVTRLSSPPPEARNLNVRFADSGEIQ